MPNQFGHMVKPLSTHTFQLVVNLSVTVRAIAAKSETYSRLDGSFTEIELNWKQISRKDVSHLILELLSRPDYIEIQTLI
jgi:hypothetical protein